MTTTGAIWFSAFVYLVFAFITGVVLSETQCADGEQCARGLRHSGFAKKYSVIECWTGAVLWIFLAPAVVVAMLSCYPKIVCKVTRGLKKEEE